MQVFKSKEKARIAELEAQLEDLSNQSEKAQRMYLSDLQNLRDQAKAQQDQGNLDRALEVEHMRGQLTELRDKSAKYDAIVLPWIWHSDGAVEIEGKEYKRYSARKDNPLADWALPVPEGMEI